MAEAIAAPDDADVLGDVDEVDVLGDVDRDDVDHPSEEPAAPASPVAPGLCNKCGTRETRRAGCPDRPFVSVAGRSLLRFITHGNYNVARECDIRTNTSNRQPARL